MFFWAQIVFLKPKSLSYGTKSFFFSGQKFFCRGVNVCFGTPNRKLSFWVRKVRLWDTKSVFFMALKVR